MIKFTRSISSKIYSKKYFSTLFLAEHNNKKLNPANYNTLKAATQLNEKVDVLVTGHNINSIVEQIQTTFPKDLVEKIYVFDHAALATPISDIYEHAFHHIYGSNANKYNYVIASSSSFGKDLIPRLAAPCDCQPITDVIGIINKDSFIRPIYASNALAHVKSLDKTKFLTVRHTNFEKYVPQQGHKIENVEKVDFETIISKLDKNSLTKLIEENLITGDKPELTSAKIVVSGGRALKSAENFKLLDELASVSRPYILLYQTSIITFIQALGNAAVGASRAAVDAGYVPNDLQIGQTGKVVAPELYIAIGISGAIQHLAGMKDSKVIVAINKDPEAPIFQVANYGLVGDLFTIVPELTKKLKEAKP